MRLRMQQLPTLSLLHCKCAAKDVQKRPFCFHFPSSSYQVITGSPLKYQHGGGTLVTCWKGDIGHLVIMTSSLCLYCLCIICSIRAEIIDFPFMQMLWIWSVPEQILSHVVFRAWHLKRNEEIVQYQSDSRMFLLWLQDPLVLTRPDTKREWDRQMYFTSAC